MTDAAKAETLKLLNGLESGLLLVALEARYARAVVVLEARYAPVDPGYEAAHAPLYGVSQIGHPLVYSSEEVPLLQQQLLL